MSLECKDLLCERTAEKRPVNPWVYGEVVMGLLCYFYDCDMLTHFGFIILVSISVLLFFSML